ncbi:MAG TPA: DUF488 domain-containing protein [Gemmatimonadales bacterium]|jgi:uncharacterized protein (DUF488 family)|nr:DUF488 domain-containing protein [Gemmatimonadales bacterium]
MPTLYTIGHSTRSSEEFIALLRENGIELLVDVRSIPGSRRVPQFGKEALRASLESAGMEYHWLPELGGRRKTSPDSRNTAWRHPAFRGYADYMETDEFALALDELANLACAVTTAIMCAEAVWWRCHRSMIADAMKWAGFEVRHIMAPGKVVEHPWTSAARVVKGELSYERA